MTYDDYVEKWRDLWDSVWSDRAHLRSYQTGAFWILEAYWMLKTHEKWLPKGELFDEVGNVKESDDFLERAPVWMVDDDTDPCWKNAKFLKRDESSGLWRVRNANGKTEKSNEGGSKVITHDEFVTVRIIYGCVHSSSSMFH